MAERRLGSPSGWPAPFAIGEPVLAVLQDVGAILLAGVRRLLWDGPPLPPAPGYGAGVFERKERTYDYRDPWN